MNNVKIIRLISGEDIISVIEEIDEGLYLLSSPMIFDIGHRNQSTHISMGHFLPVQVMQQNEMVLHFKDILFMVNPTEEFMEYYGNSVDKLKASNASNGDDVGSNPEMMEFLMQSLDDLDPKEHIKH